MIKVNGELVENCPEGYNINDLLKGELHSEAFSFIKTPLSIYCTSIEGLLEYAKTIKKHDSSYDVLDIYYEYDDFTEDREFMKSIRI